MKETLNELVRSAGILKTIRRSGWVKKASITNAESVADHTYRMTVIGLVLATELNLDATKTIRMCLIHDLAESRIGDLMPEEKKNARDHRAKEDVAMRKILARLPKKSKNLLSADWKELLSSRSKEARLVWQLDKLEMGMQMKDYLASGYPAKHLIKFDPSHLLDKKSKQILRRYS